MANARLAKELLVKTANKVGMLAEVTGAISGTGANIQAICAYGEGENATFYVVTDDNKKAEGVLKGKGYTLSENEVVLIGLENRPGAAKGMADKLKAAGIDLNYIYGTTHGKGEALIVLNSNNNAKVLEAVK